MRISVYWALSGVVLVMGLGGCGSAAAGGSSSVNAQNSSSASASSKPSSTSSSASSSAAAMSSSSAASSGATTTQAPAGSPVKTGQASVAGKTETVLTTSAGMTLYYFTPDTTSTSACSGKCATLWPPLTAPGMSVKAPSGLSGTLTVVADSHGNQIAYNGHLLYTFVKDKKPGEAVGQGVLHKWFVATPGLPSAK